MIIVRAIRDAPFTERLKKDLTDELMLRVPRSDALLAVLLASLPNLERLEIAIENPGLYLFLPREANLFERALGTPAGVTAVYTDGQPDGQRTLLPKLWQLKAEVAGDSPAGNIIALKQIVQLRKVTHFYGVRWSRPLRSPANLHGDLSNLVYIELRECVFPNHVTERLFSGAFNLSTLIYQRGWNWNHDMTHFVGTRSLRLALRPLGGTLTCLELSFNRSGRNSQETLFVRPINLWFLYCLKRLRISAGHLVTSARKEHMINRHHESFWDWEGTLNAGRPVRQLLPPRLEKLEIIQVEDRDEFNTLCDKLLSCLAYRASPEFNQTRELESLKEIVLEHQFEDQSPRLVKLHEAADRVGVKLITLHNCVESTTTGITRPVRADKEIDWGFDREVKWKHPFIWKDEVVVKTP
ncbi:uncharacterized protein N7515_005886 [Penicillium bovifimosum]|uniref:Uncharacterized protein n=1 Tax=Penicillium bovifimosum TaxID=126998 RepID=A0A9W9GTT9_9EURO|nr:uncharacterized protein N7515_005886 [Penicillium bovifimosum]KAJ5129847.1 hypothetical protein N7515_005886 [Penicillium bovifimosum]